MTSLQSQVLAVIAEKRAVLEKATKGKWTLRDHGRDEECNYIESPSDGVCSVFTDYGGANEEQAANARAIALAHNSWAADLDAIEALARRKCGRCHFLGWPQHGCDKPECVDDRLILSRWLQANGDQHE